MPRATRSKKIVIAEDNTVISLQTPLPDTPRKARPALAEISHNLEEEVMTVEDAELATQLKGLKAAYKTAIGVKKNKKGKNKKKGKEQLELIGNGSSQDVVDDQQPAVVSPAAEGARQILSSDEENTPSTKEQHNAPPSPAVREARQQLAKTRLGQFDSAVSLPEWYNSGLLGKHLNFTSINSPSCGRLIQNGMAGHYAPSRGPITDTIYHLAGANESRMADRDRDIGMSRSPTKVGITTLEEVETACEEHRGVSQTPLDTTEDSFVEQITSRSPAKPVSRIEDSVEALDKMEEAIEAFGKAAVAVPPSDTSPSVSVEKKAVRGATKDSSSVRVKSQGSRGTEKARVHPLIVSPTENAPETVAEKRAANGTTKGSSSLRIKSHDSRGNITVTGDFHPKAKEVIKKTKSSSAMRDAVEVSGGKVIVSKKPIKRPASLLPPKQQGKSAKPVTRPTFELPGEAVARKLKEQSEARKAQRESSDNGQTAVTTAPRAPKIKSSKPPTKPTFELPGEALSRRKREAHEARLKAQEEEEKKRREFKAKPPRKSSLPDFVPRDTVASRARKSIVGMPENDSGAAGQPYNSLSIGKRGSIVGAHRPSISAANLANISASRAPGPSAKVPHTRTVSTTKGPSMSNPAMQRTVSVSEAQLQRQRAKEIYMRDMKALEELEKEKKEREAAAKKSRLEAAERGRQASREWAEKQRAKKAAEAGNVTIAAGFGPGGQLGLKA